MRSRGRRLLLAGLLLTVVAGGAASVASYFVFFRNLPDLRGIEDYQPPLASRVYDRKGREIGQFYEERRQLTPLEEIPDHVIYAFVSGEDSTFFEHAGIDFASILRAAWVNLRAGGEIRQGGSTITQQMVKGLLLTPERSYRRKVREMILARDIENYFSKEEILYLYLNQIYFGHGAYGIGEAARTYFDKAVSELSLSEGALLAGLPKAPSRYSPFANPEAAERRRLYVLERMLDDLRIDAVTHATARIDRPVLTERDDESLEVAAYFIEEVRRNLFASLGGDQVLRGGLRIETTLDLDDQRGAVAAVQKGLENLDRRQGYRGPLRSVPAAEIPTELERLELANQLDHEAAISSPVGEEIAAGIDEQLTGAHLLGDGPFLGVVTQVNEEGDFARIGFAPSLEGIVRLKDVSWAREPAPKKRPRDVKDIEKIFALGDVARFTRVVRDPEEEVAPDVLLVTLHQDPIAQAALLSFEVDSDEVLAMVGGYDYATSQFNRVTQARRQPGSAFKPLIYAAAMARDYTPASIIYDRPVVYVDPVSGFTWRPENYKKIFYGPITLREALVRSVNNATVHLFHEVGVDYVIDFARRLGIQSPLSRDLSLALGSSGMSLLEITRAYGVFAAGGRRVMPTFIRRVTDRNGDVLLEDVPLGNPPEEKAPEEALALEEAPDQSLLDLADSTWVDGPDQIMFPEDAFLTVDLLRAVVSDPGGTGWRLKQLRRPLAGKTGTTNDQGDAWFIGFSANVATGVWVGHDEGRKLGWGETGSRASAPIWVNYMRGALADRPVRDFPVPEEIVFARIDRKTGLLAEAGSDSAVFQAFLTGTVPTETAHTARSTSLGRRLLRMDSF